MDMFSFESNKQNNKTLNLRNIVNVMDVTGKSPMQR